MLKFLGGCVLLAISTVLGAYAVSSLWLWFVVPLGIKAIGLVHAYGLSIIVHYMTMEMPDHKKLAKEPFASRVGFRILLTLTALGLGYVTHTFM